MFARQNLKNAASKMSRGSERINYVRRTIAKQCVTKGLTSLRAFLIVDRQRTGIPVNGVIHFSHQLPICAENIAL